MAEPGYEVIQNYFIQFALELTDRLQNPIKSGLFAGLGRGSPAPLPTGNARADTLERCKRGFRVTHTDAIMTQVLLNLQGELYTPEFRPLVRNLREYVNQTLANTTLTTPPMTTRVEIATQLRRLLEDIDETVNGTLVGGKRIPVTKPLSQACLELMRMKTLMLISNGLFKYGEAIEEIKKYEKNPTYVPKLNVNMDYIKRKLTENWTRGYDIAAAPAAGVASLGKEVRTLGFKTEANVEQAEYELHGAQTEAERRQKLLNGAMASGATGAGVSGQGGGRRRKQHRRTYKRKSKKTIRRRKSRRHN